MDISTISGLRISMEHLGEINLPLFLLESKKKEGEEVVPPRVVQTAILYGNNGAGKSSIARAVEEGAVEFTHLDGGRTGAEALAGKIHVFNDKYIEKNFRQLESDSISPIVLLGDAVSDQQEIEKLDADLLSTQEEVADIEEGIQSKVETENAVRNKLKERLKDRGLHSRRSWALRSREYHSHAQIMNVGPKVIDSVIAAASAIDGVDMVAIAQLESEFADCVERLRRARKSTIVNWVMPRVNLGFEIGSVSDAVQSVSPKSTTRRHDSVLLERIQASGDSLTDLEEKLESLFLQPDESCPHCFQEINEEFRVRVRGVISRHLQAVEEDAAHARLSEMRIDWSMDLGLPKEAIADGASRERVEVAYESLLRLCREVDGRIAEKIDNPSLTIAFDDLDLAGAVETLEAALIDFSCDVKAHNQLQSRVSELADEAAALSISLAGQEVFSLVSEMKNLQRDKAVLEARLMPLAKRTVEIESGLHALREKQLSEEQAARRVNTLLSIVLGETGLRIRATEVGYTVLNRARDVSPSWLSTGERNVLALCYFLVSTANGTSFDEEFLSDRVLILDDPISSFDNDNKFGVVALMNWLAWTCGGKQKSTKIAIFTHDASVAYDLSKTFVNACEGHRDWRLENGGLKRVNFEYVDNYGETLCRMYRFAIDCSDAQEDHVSPNDVRRVWEAFATFELGENPTNAIDSPRVRALLVAMDEESVDGPDYSFFFKAFPGRSFLHADSHSSVQTRNFDYYMTPALDDSGLRRFVAGVLLLMHAISPLHIPARMGGGVGLAEQRRKELEARLRGVGFGE